MRCVSEGVGVVVGVGDLLGARRERGGGGLCRRDPRCCGAGVTRASRRMGSWTRATRR